MDAQQFAYWLQGFAELSGDAPPTKAQWKSIREHLTLVFTKITPKVSTKIGDNVAQQNPDWANEILRQVRQQPSSGTPFMNPHPITTCSTGQVLGNDDRGVVVMC